MAARNPNVLWAQLRDKVFLTLDIQEAEKPVVNVTNKDATGNISFKGKAKSHALGADYHEYSLDLDLHGAVDSDKSKISATARHIVLVIVKESGSEGYWPRLTKDKSKHPYIKVMQAVLFGGGIDAPPNALSFVEEADGFPLDSCQRNLRVDWDKWVDEDDDADETAADPTSQFDFSDLSGFSGAGDDDNDTGKGATPLVGEDSDDEELPDLEKA